MEVGQRTAWSYTSYATHPILDSFTPQCLAQHLLSPEGLIPKPQPLLLQSQLQTQSGPTQTLSLQRCDSNGWKALMWVRGHHWAIGGVVFEQDKPRLQQTVPLCPTDRHCLSKTRQLSVHLLNRNATVTSCPCLQL